MIIRGEYLITIGVVVIILGILLLFLGSALLSPGKGEGSGGTSQIRGGGVVMIGPIPIIFGTDKNSILGVVILAIILMVITYLLFYR